ncbi:MAG TPA: hypothetical protein VFK02_02530 [Kofleriaceae bacterium]|nr:hypothetical protein [Kofleriaceae bacterium]
MHRLAVPSLAALAIVSAAGPVAADPLWQAEVRAGYGIAAGGSGAAMSTRPSPVTLAAIATLAFDDEPPLSGYGGLLVEALDRNSVGSVFGVTLAPRASRIRLSAGGAWIVAPYTLLGATASGGACVHVASRIRVCGDLQLTAYFAGSDLAEGHTVTQVQLVAGMVLDGP